MTTYTAITIGPIGHTFSLARKPREFWAASYLYSYLMKSIIQSLKDNGIEVISPAEPTLSKLGVGLYPDRVFFEGGEDFKFNIEKFCNDLEISEVKDYFKVLKTSGEYDSAKAAIIGLNKKLDRLELSNYTFDKESEDAIHSLLQKENKEVKEKNHDSKWPDIFLEAFKDRKFPIESLEDLARKYETDGKKHSFNDYFCIVQADGDNMGKTIENGDITKISQALISYAQEVVPMIRNYGGMPIYAGGDDLLFIAPVVGKDEKNVLDLISEIDKIFNEKFKDMKGNPSLSYGISITYYKFPLYEAWKKASSLLFDKAKNVNGKNAIAWELQKHAGSSFTGAFSKSNTEDTDLYKAFKDVIAIKNQKETLVSAVSHKLRGNEGLLELFKKSSDLEVRLNAFFNKIIDAENAQDYKDKVKELLKQLYATNEENITRTIYGMLRTAKFINGEEDKE